MASMNAVLTDMGVSLLAKAIAEKTILDIDEIVIGDGKYDGEVYDLKAIVSPLEVIASMGSMEYINGADGEKSYLKITVNVLNGDLTEAVFIREIGLLAKGNLVAYAWIKTEDTDNMLPPPADIGVTDSIHTHVIALLVSNRQSEHLNISFSYGDLVTHGYLNQRLESLQMVGEQVKELEDILKEFEKEVSTIRDSIVEGSMQENLNADMVDGKHASMNPNTNEKNDLVGMINEVRTRNLNTDRLNNYTAITTPNTNNKSDIISMINEVRTRNLNTDRLNNYTATTTPQTSNRSDIIGMINEVRARVIDSGVIKSIQRGTVWLPLNTVYINEIDPSKSVVVITGGVTIYGGSFNQGVVHSWSVSLGVSNITFHWYGGTGQLNSNPRISWQVIEFN